jgi:hypothetical protein
MLREGGDGKTGDRLGIIPRLPQFSEDFFLIVFGEIDIVKKPDEPNQNRIK